MSEGYILFWLHFQLFGSACLKICVNVELRLLGDDSADDKEDNRTPTKQFVQKSLSIEV